MIACFTGAQGTGKTTLLETLKSNEALSKYDYKGSFTRELLEKGYKINEEGDNRTQRAIMNGHVNNLKDVNKNTIFDRCAIDGYVYTLYLYSQGKITAKTMEFATEKLHECLAKYDRIFYIIPEFAPEEDGTRSGNVDYRDDIAQLFQETIDFIKTEGLCKVTIVKGPFEKRVKKVTKILEKC